jgi:antitoxin ParD1/3/4
MAQGCAVNVSLTPELEKFVEAKVESGRYTSASEVVREALRLLEEQEQIRREQLSVFHLELSHRLEAMDKGRFANPKTVREGLRQRSAERRAKTV